jgi:hypothetical protein
MTALLPVKEVAHSTLQGGLLITYAPIGDLRPYPHNARVHSKHQVRPQGDRAIDHLASAYAEVMKETEEHHVDVLGEIHMNCITFGEHGQFFTPEPISRMMAEITLGDAINAPTVSDPACGSGTLLIEAGKKNPRAVLYGVDIDERCAKMCALNMLFFGFDAFIRCGDTLAMKFHTEWKVCSFGTIYEKDISKEVQVPPQPVEPVPKKPSPQSLFAA